MGVSEMKTPKPMTKKERQRVFAIMCDPDVVRKLIRSKPKKAGKKK